jgi:hypothetical protein
MEGYSGTIILFFVEDEPVRVSSGKAPLKIDYEGKW